MCNVPHPRKFVPFKNPKFENEIRTKMRKNWNKGILPLPKFFPWGGTAYAVKNKKDLYTLILKVICKINSWLEWFKRAKIHKVKLVTKTLSGHESQSSK